jgi:Holliday junction DNA helicase RuvA
VIGRLSGLVVERAADGTCVLDVQGVGYEVTVPVRTLPSLPAPPERVTLHVHTHVREDALKLFGFDGEADRAAFRVLQSVAGVGTKLAMSVLSELDAAALSQVVARSDYKRLTAISGIGKKTAERMVLELRDKVSALAHPGSGGALVGAAGAPTSSLGGRAGEVAAALASLGFSRAQADAAASRVVTEPDERPLEALVKQALLSLS